MADDLVIEAKGVSKRFCRGLRKSLSYGMQDLFRELTTGKRPSDNLRAGEFWALQDVGVRLKRGEALGLIGRNGAGKTTLLRVIAGLIRPDKGEVKTWGRLVPLLALGAGFNPILSGRENIFVNMSILGLPTKEIKKKLDAVIDFAEIAEAVDAPVRTYSSGMAARLGFACAIHTAPDVLLLDEVLAVGDMAFRTKCFRQLAELRKAGTAFVLVTHSPHVVTMVCDRGLYLRGGKVAKDAGVHEAAEAYEDDLNPIGDASGATPTGWRREPSVAAPPSGLEILAVTFESADGTPGLRSGEPGVMDIDFRTTRPFDALTAGAAVREAGGLGDPVLMLRSENADAVFRLEPGAHRIRLRMSACNLRVGLYSFKPYVAAAPFSMLDCIESVPAVVEAEPERRALARDSRFFQPQCWSAETLIQDRGTTAVPEAEAIRRA